MSFFLIFFFPQKKKDEPKSKLIHTLRPRTDTHARTHPQAPARARGREGERGRGSSATIRRGALACLTSSLSIVDRALRVTN